MDNTLSHLINALRCLPGVGPKSAQRMVYHLLNNQRDRGLHLANCLHEAMVSIKHCQRCNNYTSQNLCALCINPNRNTDILCVVESPADVIAIEQSRAFDGYYYVLMGRVSPMDGIGPEDIGLSRLQEVIASQQIHEVIIALSPSIEGQTTGFFIQELLRNSPVRITQLAHGIPSGGELEYLDGHTIGSALRNRLALE
jgi:recombination protein RecR